MDSTLYVAVLLVKCFPPPHWCIPTWTCLFSFLVPSIISSDSRKQCPMFSFNSENEGKEGSLKFSTTRSLAWKSVMEDDDLEFFDSLEEGEVKFSANLELENENERREVEGS